MTEEQKLFEQFKKFQEQQDNKFSEPKEQKQIALGDYLLTMWAKYWKYIAIIGLITYACFKILFPYLNELMPDKHLFDEGSYTQLIFSAVACMCALVFSIFMQWLSFKTSDMFMGKSANSNDGWAYMFDTLDVIEHGQTTYNKGKLWKILISLFIFCFFFFMFLYGVGLPK